MLIYSTQRVVKIPSRCLAITYYFVLFFVIIYIGGYGLGYSKAYQARCPVESTVVTKVKGVLSTNYTDKELQIPNPEFYRRVWDANDIITQGGGEASGGFFILTNVIITPNQTRGICSEDHEIPGSNCKIDKDCPIGKSLLPGHGVFTGKCVTNIQNANIKTCQIDAWCPIEKKKLPLNEAKPLLLDTQDFTVLVKNSIEFPEFGPSYKRRNILDYKDSTYLQNCIYNPKTDLYCPVFRIGDVVKYAKQDYNKIGLTGGVIAIKISWDCSFDWGKSIKDCLPKYSFSRLDNPNAALSPGYNFRSTVYHEENRRTLTQNFGLKFIIEVEGDGRKFDSIKFILATGASMGLFAVASLTCDYVFKLLCFLKNKLSWNWLSYYSEEMKYDLTFIAAAISKRKSRSKNKKTGKNDISMQEFEPIQNLTV